MRTLKIDRNNKAFSVSQIPHGNWCRFIYANFIRYTGRIEKDGGAK